MKVQKYICPECRALSGVDILYGMPGVDAAEMEARGELVLGGCCIDLSAAECQCLACGCQWRIRRQYRRWLQEEMALGFMGLHGTPPETFHFFIGGYSGPNHSLEWRDGALVYRGCDGGVHEIGVEERKLQPAEQAWNDFYRAVIDAGVGNWRRQYRPPLEILDGTHWTLHLKMDDLRVDCEGDNAYPAERQWRAFLRAVSNLVGCRIA